MNIPTRGIEIGAVIVVGILGAGLGAIVGGIFGHSGWGTVIGAGVGGVGGYVAGRDTGNALQGAASRIPTPSPSQ